MVEYDNSKTFFEFEMQRKINISQISDFFARQPCIWRSTNRIVELHKNRAKKDRLTRRTMSTRRSRVLAGSSVFLVKKINEAPQSDAAIGLYLRPFVANNFRFKRVFDIFLY